MRSYEVGVFHENFRDQCWSLKFSNHSNGNTLWELGGPVLVPQYFQPIPMENLYGKLGDQCWSPNIFNQFQWKTFMGNWGTSAGLPTFSTNSNGKPLWEIWGPVLVSRIFSTNSNGKPLWEVGRPMLEKCVGLRSRQERPIAGPLCTLPLTHLPLERAHVLVP